MASKLNRCPLCGWQFRIRLRVQPAETPKQLFVAIDVSTSVHRYTSQIHASLVDSLHDVRSHGPFDLAIYLFNRSVMPFPCESLCKPLPYERAYIPSCSELRHRVGGGTALLDAINRLIEDASGHTSQDRRILLLTDGWERSSRQTNAMQLRHRIQQCRDQIQISIIGFVNRQTRQRLLTLISELGLDNDLCSFSLHNATVESISDSIVSMSDSFMHFSSDSPRRPSDMSSDASRP